MRIIAVDDEKIALEGLLNILKKVAQGEEIQGFRFGKKALEYARDNLCDVAVLDIEMRDLKGTVLAEKLKELNPNINIIFTTGYSEYAPEAFSMHASGYLMKPVTSEKVKRELEELRNPVKGQREKRIHIRTFGNFEVFDPEGRQIKFRYKKTKELLAYLVDRRGDLCSMQECMEILWEDEDPASHISYAKNLRADLRKCLEEAGAGDALARQRGYLAIVPDKVYCDYYEYLKGFSGDGTVYLGEYMNQYEWAQTSRDTLTRD